MVPTPTRVLTTTAHSMDYLTANTKLECLQIWRIPKMLRCDLKFRQLLTVDNELLQYHEYIFRSSEKRSVTIFTKKKISKTTKVK